MKNEENRERKSWILGDALRLSDRFDPASPPGPPGTPPHPPPAAGDWRGEAGGQGEAEGEMSRRKRGGYHGGASGWW